MTDLMAWNADATRMPSEYLRRLLLNNDLAEGHYEVDGRPVWFTDIRIPSFAVGTVSDHVAPWRSVYKIHLVATDDVTFVLTSGGHNAGIVSKPGHPGRAYQVAMRRPGEDAYLDPDTWLEGSARSARILVARMAVLACPAFDREGGPAADGCAREGIPDAPGCTRPLCPAVLKLRSPAGGGRQI